MLFRQLICSGSTFCRTAADPESTSSLLVRQGTKAYNLGMRLAKVRQVGHIYSSASCGDKVLQYSAAHYTGVIVGGGGKKLINDYKTRSFRMEFCFHHGSQPGQFFLQPAPPGVRAFLHGKMGENPGETVDISGGSR